MSKKPKIKFHYGNDQDDDFRSVSSTHKGPILYDNLYNTLTNPVYDEIIMNNTQSSPQDVEVVESKAEIRDLPLADVIAKSQQNPQLHSKHSNYSTRANKQQGVISPTSSAVQDQKQVSYFKKPKQQTTEIGPHVNNHQSSSSIRGSTSPQHISSQVRNSTSPPPGVYVTGGEGNTGNYVNNIYGGSGYNPKAQKEFAQTTYVTGGSGYNKTARQQVGNTTYKKNDRGIEAFFNHLSNPGSEYQGGKAETPGQDYANNTSNVKQSKKENNGCFSKNKKSKEVYPELHNIQTSPREIRSHSSQSFSSSEDEVIKNNRNESCFKSSKTNAKKQDKLKNTNQSYQTYQDEHQDAYNSNVVKPNSKMIEVRETSNVRSPGHSARMNDTLDNPDGGIRLKSPSYKYNPDTANEMRAGKKDYVKSGNNEKYLYTGIPEKKESDFIGCFGCCAPKTKTTYKTQSNK